MSLIKVSDLTKLQKSIVESVPRGVKFIEGVAGTGKTTTGVRRMLRLLTKDKVFANEIFVLVPQKTLGQFYFEAANDPKLDAGGRITVGTIGSLSLSTVDLFFPLVSEYFGNPNGRPTFLSLETAQYHMARVVGQIIDDRAYFDTIAIARNRLYSQIIDNLNKAAVVGFPHTDIAERLKLAWGDKDRAQRTVYDHAQECANLFREYCLQHNLVDFSLQVELFRELWTQPAVRDYLIGKYRHLIVDNIEEDTPITHDLLLDWIPDTESTLLIRDTRAGYRRFLGAAPKNTDYLRTIVTTARDYFEFSDDESFVTSPVLRSLGGHLAIELGVPHDRSLLGVDPRNALSYDQPRYYTDMIAQVADKIAEQVHGQDVSPQEIVVLAPFLSDSLRFTLMQYLESRDVKTWSHRPSRALREEPAATALLTWAQLAHPEWKLPPTHFELTNALMNSIEGLDLVRAQLISDVLYNTKNGEFRSFDKISSGVQERITFTLGEKLQKLYEWLVAYDENPLDELDLFWQRLFDEFLSRPGGGFHHNVEAIRAAGNLIDSARNFRQIMRGISLGHPLSLEYVLMVRDGVIANQYMRDWSSEPEDAVLLAPAYTFLMMNRPVDYQYWLNVGSSGWWERLYQPLTHPYVLTREWDWEQLGTTWTDDDEYYSRNETMYAIAFGLINRCREGIYLGVSEFGEQGYEQRGALLGAIQGILRRFINQEVGNV